MSQKIIEVILETRSRTASREAGTGRAWALLDEVSAMLLPREVAHPLGVGHSGHESCLRFSVTDFDAAEAELARVFAQLPEAGFLEFVRYVQDNPRSAPAPVRADGRAIA